MKRTPLKRKASLVRKTWLKRTEFKPRRKKPDISAAIRRAVYERADGQCEMNVPDICTRRATQIDHIKNRSQGACHTMGELQACCFECHHFKTNNPNAAEALGIYRRGWQ